MFEKARFGQRSSRSTSIGSLSSLSAESSTMLSEPMRAEGRVEGVQAGECAAAGGTAAGGSVEAAGDFAAAGGDSAGDDESCFEAFQADQHSGQYQESVSSGNALSHSLQRYSSGIDGSQELDNEEVVALGVHLFQTAQHLAQYQETAGSMIAGHAKQ